MGQTTVIAIRKTDKDTGQTETLCGKCAFKGMSWDQRQEIMREPVAHYYGVEYQTISDNQVDYSPMIICDNCDAWLYGEDAPEEEEEEGSVEDGTARLYTDDIDADEQITTEERIAAILFDATHGLDEEVCAGFGRRLLYEVLRTFRPDLLA